MGKVSEGAVGIWCIWGWGRGVIERRFGKNSENSGVFRGS